ncbi:MAG TPA: hypothetical protein IGS17_19405 [Oscillatoriales cyanobacterium M59_W2019_021]|nr:hypothetical protein [Oscillatoriales cyanobacterium M4454_W2019_049]HIK53066.1 hypothetical protein [Oscillatoriales cyanobacterium M59_W2019_021]
MQNTSFLDHSESPRSFVTDRPSASLELPEIDGLGNIPHTITGTPPLEKSTLTRDDRDKLIAP